MLNLIIDTDIGVDDALAVAWLCQQTEQSINILGISAVAGNTAVSHVANNALALLEKLNRQDIPIVVGAEKPLHRSLSKTVKMLHGPDGLWFAAQPARDISQLPTDVTAFYRRLLATQERVSLLTLGPLTNLAKVLQEDADLLHQFERIMILGGTRGKGSVTPVSEYNFWQDPEAAQQLFAARLPITLVPREAFTQFLVTAADVREVLGRETAVSQFLAPPVQRFVDIQLQYDTEKEVPLPDLTTAILITDQSLYKTKPALIKIITDDGLTRGQSIIGFSFNEQLTMIADDAELGVLVDEVFSNRDFDFTDALQAIMRREPPNVQIVTKIDVPKIRKLLLQTPF